MDIDQIKQAIADSKDSLKEAFKKNGGDPTNESMLAGWSAWEWSRQQLMGKGMSKEAADAMISVYLVKQRRLGTYGAIQEMLFGDQTTLIIT